METALHSPSTGLRTFDLQVATAPVSVSDIHAGRNGFAMLRQLPIGRPIEQRVPPTLDHVGMIMLRAPRDGEGVLGGGTRRPFDPKPGDVTIGPAGCGSEWLQPHGDAEFVQLHLSPQRLELLLGEDETRGQRVEIVPKLVVTDQALTAIARNCLAELAQPGIASAALLDSYAIAFGVHLLRMHSTLSSKVALRGHAIAPYRLGSAKEFVEAHLDENIGLEEIAANAGLSPFHFSRVFKQATGSSPYRYLSERRVAKAQALLVDTAMPIAEIALTCGFLSQQQFTTTFRKIVGSTPARYRASYRF